MEKFGSRIKSGIRNIASLPSELIYAFIVCEEDGQRDVEDTVKKCQNPDPDT